MRPIIMLAAFVAFGLASPTQAATLLLRIEGIIGGIPDTSPNHGKTYSLNVVYDSADVVVNSISDLELRGPALAWSKAGTFRSPTIKQTAYSTSRINPIEVYSAPYIPTPFFRVSLTSPDYSGSTFFWSKRGIDFSFPQVIDVSGVDGSTSISKISIQPFSGAIPEPSTWALMLIGFGAIGSLSRRRRRTFLRSAATSAG
jgi:hypothetical protein